MAVCCGCGQLSAEVVEPPNPKPCEVFVCNYLVLAAVMEKKGRDTRHQFYLEFFLEGLLMKIQKFVIVVSNLYLYLLIIDMI